MLENKAIANAMTIKLDLGYPEMPAFQEGIRRAPDRGFRLTKAQTKIALRNALRYVPEELHEKLAPEFMEELKTYGRVYAYRYRPAGRIYGKPIDEYKGNCLAGKAFQVMIDNNLDFEVALYPYELVTYGETGSVCQNWLQYNLIKRYLEEMTDEQTLVVESGHPLGLFPSKPEAPRVIITNSMMIGMYDNLEDWEVAEEMGVANYGQMTAGGWMYIGPQGIVHGTFNTILNAGRKELGVPEDGDLAGKTFVSSGLGGMSGAQPKAANIANAVGIFAEVDQSRIDTRHDQGWVDVVCQDLDEVFKLAQEKIDAKESISIAYHGNIVDLLESAVERNFHIDLLSDQTSCHNVYDGGYCPVGYTFEERTQMLHEDRDKFCKEVDKTLHRHFAAIKALTEKGTYFFDYGNSFMKAMYDAGVKELSKNGVDDKDGFIWPSYPQSDRPGSHGRHRPEQTRSGQRQLDLDQRRREEQAGRRNPGQDPLSGCRGKKRHRTGLQQAGQRRQDRPGHDGKRPPRRFRNGLPVQRDLQHQGRLQRYGGYGSAVLRRKRSQRHEPLRSA